MIKIKLPRTLVDKHWDWFRNILDDVEDWYQPKEMQSSIVGTAKISRRQFIYNQFGFTNDNQIRELICANYRKMRYFIAQPLYLSKTFYNHNDKRGLGQTRISEADRNALIRVFGYEEFTDLDEPYQWGAYTFFEKLGVDVCPYCNRQYIFTITKNKRGLSTTSSVSSKKHLIRPQVEHFFPKSKYPYLSCSIYNLVPGCSICNSKKSTVDTFLNPMIYPYREEFGKKGHFFVDFDVDKIKERDDAKFEKELEDDIKVRILPDDGSNLDPKIKKSIKQLILEELYSCHQVEIKNILKRFRMSTLSNISRYDGMKLDSKLAKDIILGLPFHGNLVYPLQKLNEDIIEQLDVGKKRILGKNRIR